MSGYKETEITSTVKLCDSKGALNPDAVGFSRFPLQDCNLSGHWPRKKRWNYWNVTTDTFCFSATVSNVDYVGLIFVYLVDFETKECIELTIPAPLGIGCKQGHFVGDDAVFKSKLLSVSLVHNEGGLRIKADSPVFGGKKLSADIAVKIPEGHETLNVVVPWGEEVFQFTSKQNTLPAEGEVRVGDKTYVFEAGESFACLDFGRGIWPYKTKWNWASFSHKQGNDVIGLNMGGMWTDGTGSTENGFCLNGKLYKVSDDSVITYNRKNFMEPWTLETPESGAVSLKFTPFYDKAGGINLLLIKTAVHQCFGRFDGTLKADGKTVEVKNAIGWAEESISSW